MKGNNIHVQHVFPLFHPDFFFPLLKVLITSFNSTWLLSLIQRRTVKWLRHTLELSLYFSNMVGIWFTEYSWDYLVDEYAFPLK